MEVRANRLAAAHHRTQIFSQGSNILGTTVPTATGDNSTGATKANATGESITAKLGRYAAVLERSSTQVTGLADRIFATDQEGERGFGFN